MRVLSATKKYVSNNCQNFLQTTFQVCQSASEEYLKRIAELLSTTDCITNTTDIMMKFFMDLLNIVTNDDRIRFYTSSQRVDTIISCALHYIEKQDTTTLTTECVVLVTT